jgi:hypothetical protein
MTDVIVREPGDRRDTGRQQRQGWDNAVISLVTPRPAGSLEAGGDKGDPGALRALTLDFWPPTPWVNFPSCQKTRAGAHSHQPPRAGLAASPGLGMRARSQLASFFVTRTGCSVAGWLAYGLCSLLHVTLMCD